jgi:phosphoenolpyruvate carboxykinase (ATP)
MPIFNLSIPVSCPGVPSELLNPRNTWENKDAYDQHALHLATLFVKNFEKYAAGVSPEIMAAAPTI